MMPCQLPELFHLGWVVRDCDAAVADLGGRFGAGPFHQFPGAYRFEEALVRGKPTPFSLKIAFGVLGGILVELLEPLDEVSPHAEFLSRNGEGLHHLAYLVADFDEQLAAAREATSDRQLLVDGSGPGNPVRWAYLEGDATHGAVIELLERSPKAEEAFHDVLALLER